MKRIDMVKLFNAVEAEWSDEVMALQYELMKAMERIEELEVENALMECHLEIAYSAVEAMDERIEELEEDVEVAYMTIGRMNEDMDYLEGDLDNCYRTIELQEEVIEEASEIINELTKDLV